MINYVYHDSEDHFADKTSCISGIVKLAIDWHSDFSADIGGIDGNYCVATMIEVKVGTKTFTADDVAEMFGAKVVTDFEQWVAEYEAEDN